ncbi:NADP-specific glutamate dehydrogenase [Olivibacter sp. SDN3]|uniref:NADP-specific glutamate dehydrogenase n=1 Tax=Olivibacter sp. SDN3 TaxID=2764720 RepID=UPI0016519FF4|nr:NADP-specific glutamate dehydrogenase [Olivibacter sp. SDN3]QNL48631.1 NADP-specific glutamate dehydrogenase [Olivibacter sp. SDN3]
MNTSVKKFINHVKQKNKGEKEFIQSVAEVSESVIPYIASHTKYDQTKILERMIEPERVIMFRVPWLNDQGEVEVNRGYRVQMNSAIGPYKGGLRFSPTVNLSILKFLAFEQVFKNSLTGLPLGAGKGGADFDPRGRSDNEVMKFCQSFMTELHKHVGEDMDIPAGDIGVGKREIGYLFGQYKRIKGEFTGVITGKGSEWGGSHIRPEATGYGLVYFVEEILKKHNKSLKGKKIAVSGAGNVAQYAAEKCIEQGAKVITLSDSKGTVYNPKGISVEELEFIKDLKNKRGELKDFAKKYAYDFLEGEKPWGIKCDIALPNATQNELNEEDAQKLVENDCFCVAEGANMPCTPEAIAIFNEYNVFYAPGKAANAGGVAVSGLEMSQNSLRYSWTRNEVDSKLRQIMQEIHQICVKYGKEKDYINYEKGANVGGFVRIADAMLAQGLV